MKISETLAFNVERIERGRRRWGRGITVHENLQLGEKV